MDSVPAGVGEQSRAKTGARLLETQPEQHPHETIDQLLIRYSHGLALPAAPWQRATNKRLLCGQGPGWPCRRLVRPPLANVRPGEIAELKNMLVLRRGWHTPSTPRASGLNPGCFAARCADSLHQDADRKTL